MSNRYYVVPDIHGCKWALDKALYYIYSNNPQGCKIIFLGDYIDRGNENFEVVTNLMNPKETYEFVCLLGNHEDMFLNAVSGNNKFFDMNAAFQLSDLKIKPYFNFELVDRIDKSILEWFLNLKLFHIEGKNVFAHASFDTSAKKQDKELVIWSRHPNFKPTSKYALLVHGHTPKIEAPVILNNSSINLDAGVFVHKQFVIAEFSYDKILPIAYHRFDK